AAQGVGHLGRGEGAPLGLLDLLGHAVEGLERRAIAEAGHGLVDALLRLGALLFGDEQVLLALGFLDLVVELAQRLLQPLRLVVLAAPGLLERDRALGMLLLPQQRLLRQVVASLAHGQHGAVLPVAGELLLIVELRAQLALIRDRDRDLLLRLRELLAHVDENLVQHLLRVLRTRDRIVDVRAKQRRQLLPDAHCVYPSCATGTRPASSGRWPEAARTMLSYELRSSLKSRSSSSSASDRITSCASMP